MHAAYNKAHGPFVLTESEWTQTLQRLNSCHSHKGHPSLYDSIELCYKVISTDQRPKNLDHTYWQQSEFCQ